MLQALKILALFLLINLMACQAPIKQEQSKNKVFFDLKQYFGEAIEALEKSAFSLEKTVKIGDKSEAKTLETVNWSQELQVFSEADINKTAWMDKYDKDTLSQQIVYVANNSALKTQKIVLDFKGSTYLGEALTKVTINNQTDNVLYQSNETLTYMPPQKQWNIRRTQKVATGNTETIVIEGKVRN